MTENDDRLLRQDANRWLLQLALTGKEIENRTVKGLTILEAQKGFLKFSYAVTIEACDKDAYWHVGAIATLVDDVSAAAIYSATGHVKASVDFGISFFSRVKLHEDVQIGAKVAGMTGNLASVVVEVRRKDNGELIALGKQWMTEAGLIPNITKTKIDANILQRCKL